MTETDRLKSLKFDVQFREDILYGRKTATVRYGPGNRIEAGDTLQIQDDEGEPFARATVTETFRCEAMYAPARIRKRGASHGAQDCCDLVDALDGFYDEHIGHTTMVKVIIFEDAEPAGEVA